MNHRMTALILTGVALAAAATQMRVDTPATPPAQARILQTGASGPSDLAPDWAAVLDVARRAAGAVQLGYLGVDIVLDAQLGPMVIEINARPGLEIQNVHGQGMWPQVQPWL